MRAAVHEWIHHVIARREAYGQQKNRRDPEYSAICGAMSFDGLRYP